MNTTAVAAVRRRAQRSRRPDVAGVLRAATRARPAKRVAPRSTSMTTRTHNGRWKTGQGDEPQSLARIWLFDTMPPRSSVRRATSDDTTSLPDAIVNCRADLLAGVHGSVVVV